MSAGDHLSPQEFSYEDVVRLVSGADQGMDRDSAESFELVDLPVEGLEIAEPSASGSGRQWQHDAPPIVVGAGSSGFYPVWDGRHRVEAARSAGVESIPAFRARGY